MPALECCAPPAAARAAGFARTAHGTRVEKLGEAVWKFGRAVGASERTIGRKVLVQRLRDESFLPHCSSFKISVCAAFRNGPGLSPERLPRRPLLATFCDRLWLRRIGDRGMLRCGWA